jgi:hypothetical protein
MTAAVPEQTRHLMRTFSDLHRVSIYMSAVPKPISWRDVIFGGVSLGASIMVGVVKSIVASSLPVT